MLNSNLNILTISVENYQNIEIIKSIIFHLKKLCILKDNIWGFDGERFSRLISYSYLSVELQLSQNITEYNKNEHLNTTAINRHITIFKNEKYLNR